MVDVRRGTLQEDAAIQGKDKDSFDQNRVTFYVREQVLIHLDLLFLIDCRCHDVPIFNSEYVPRSRSIFLYLPFANQIEALVRSSP